MDRFVPLSAFEHETQAVVMVDAHGRPRLVNRAARRLLGLRAAQSLPRTCSRLAAFRSVDGEPFWGVDRFEQIERWLKEPF